MYLDGYALLIVMTRKCFPVSQNACAELRATLSTDGSMYPGTTERSHLSAYVSYSA